MMKEHMINGRPWKDAMEELRVYVASTQEKIEGSGQKYHGIEECVQLFDRVLGNDHYTVEFSDQNYIQIRSKQDTISVKCRITILDDDGEPIIFKESYGGYDLRYSNSSDKESNLNNAPSNACTYAFRACCKYFGAFGEYTAAKTAAPKDKGSSRQNSARSSQSEKEMLFYTEGGCYEDGTKDGKPIHKIKVHKSVDGKYVKDCAVVFFYPKYKEKCAAKFNEFFDGVKAKPFPVKFIVKPCTPIEGVEQYMFVRFA